MSLINQVLRDLDRHARPAAALPATGGAVVATVAPSRQRAMTVSALLGLLAIGCVLRLAGGSSPARLGGAEARLPAAADVPGPAAPPVSTLLPVWPPLPPLPAVTGLAADSAFAPWSFDPRPPRTSTPDDTAAPAVIAAEPPAADAPPEASLRPAVESPRIGSPLDAAEGGGVSAAALHGAIAFSAFSAVAASTASDARAAANAAITSPGYAATAAPGAAAPFTAVNAAPTPPPAAAPVSPAGPVRIEKRSVAVSSAERAEAAYRLGAAAQERGDHAEAASQYAAALHEDAGLAAARAGLAGVRVAQGRPGEAEDLLQTGLAPSPQQAVLAMPLARLLAARGELPAAIGVLRAGLPGAAAGNADYHACFGAVLQRAGQHREAAEQFSAALRLAPGNGVWWMGMAISLAADNRADAARSAYQQALAVGGLSAELVQFVEQRLR